jgi:quercetin dioxygenase-like cupin family protein
MEAVMPESTLADPTVVMHEPGGALGTWAMASLFEHLLDAPESGSDFGVALVTQPPGIAPPLHRHDDSAEAFFMLEGRMEYRAGDAQYDLYPGCFIYLPPTIPHAFRIRGDAPARFLGIVSPGNLFHLYEEVGIPAAELRLPGRDGQALDVEIPKWNDAGPRYGITVVGPPIPE